MATADIAYIKVLISNIFEQAATTLHIPIRYNFDYHPFPMDSFAYEMMRKCATRQRNNWALFFTDKGRCCPLFLHTYSQGHTVLHQQIILQSAVDRAKIVHFAKLKLNLFVTISSSPSIPNQQNKCMLA